jgi:hypothetical protein
MSDTNNRGERLQIMLTEEELRVLDDWRFSRRMPSRASAVRELLTRGLAAEGFLRSEAGVRSKDYGVSDAQNGREHGTDEEA